MWLAIFAVFDGLWTQVQVCLHKQHIAGYRAVTAMKPLGASPAAAAASASKAAIVTPQLCGSVLSCSLMGIDIMFTSTDGSPRSVCTCVHSVCERKIDNVIKMRNVVTTVFFSSPGLMCRDKCTCMYVIHVCLHKWILQSAGVESEARVARQRQGAYIC